MSAFFPVPITITSDDEASSQVDAPAAAPATPATPAAPAAPVDHTNQPKKRATKEEQLEAVRFVVGNSDLYRSKKRSDKKSLWDQLQIYLLQKFNLSVVNPNKMIQGLLKKQRTTNREREKMSGVALPPDDLEQALTELIEISDDVDALGDQARNDEDAARDQAKQVAKEEQRAMMMRLGAKRPVAGNEEGGEDGDGEGAKDGPAKKKPKFKSTKKRQAEEVSHFSETLKASMTSTFREMVAPIMQPPINSSTEEIPAAPEYASMDDVRRLEGKIDELAAIVGGLVSEMAHNKSN